MPERVIIEACAPTLAGLKTANLVNLNCAGETDRQIVREIRLLNRALAKKGVRAVPLGWRAQATEDGKQSTEKIENNKQRKASRGRRVLLYLYRPEYLRRDLCEPAAREMLQGSGYTQDDVSVNVARLARKVAEAPSSREFPHEIGLFLGYPPEDVKAFIDHRDSGCKCVGCWRVYGDEEKAKQIFDIYKKCTRVYCTQWEHGKTIDQLTVRTV